MEAVEGAAWCFFLINVSREWRCWGKKGGLIVLTEWGIGESGDARVEHGVYGLA